jgi:hypothetical protein
LRLSRSTLRSSSQTTWAFSRPLAGPHGEAVTNLVFALVAPELRGKRKCAAFERGLRLLHAGLEARLRQQ